MRQSFYLIVETFSFMWYFQQIFRYQKIFRENIPKIFLSRGYMMYTQKNSEYGLCHFREITYLRHSIPIFSLYSPIVCESREFFEEDDLFLLRKILQGEEFTKRAEHYQGY